MPFQQQEAVPAAHATSASPPAFLISPSFPFSPLSSFLLAVLSSQQCCSSALPCLLLQHPREGGHGHLQLTAKQRPAVSATSSLLPHVTFLLSLLPQASPSSTEFCGIKILQSNQNSQGHQTGTEIEQIWLQRKIQCCYVNARMATGFCRLAKFAVSVPDTSSCLVLGTGLPATFCGTLGCSPKLGSWAIFEYLSSTTTSSNDTKDKVMKHLQCASILQQC